ncbi:MAG: ABC-type transport auxiliary lipoprotein family protein [Steroidobacteraceae bacterium]
MKPRTVHLRAHCAHRTRRACRTRLPAAALAATLAAGLSACGGGLRSDAPAVQAWALDPPAVAVAGSAAAAGGASGASATPADARPAEGAVPAPRSAATLRVLRPLAAPALDSDRIALRRADRTLDYYAAHHWSGRVPELVQGLVLDTLRGAAVYRAVQPEAAPFAYDETLQVEVRDFQAEYAGAGAPVVKVGLVCTLGRRSDRAVLATFTLAGSATAADDRMHAIVAAFNAAVDGALAALPAQVAAAGR